MPYADKARDRAFHTWWDWQFRARYRAAHACVRCGVPVTKFKTCLRHRARHALRMRRWRLKQKRLAA